MQFLLLGAALFALSRFVKPAAETTAPSRQIVLTVDDLRQLQIGFASQWQRPPTEQEMMALMENRIREEVLYREALAMGLDKDDTIVKRRMAQKMEFLAEDVSTAHEPTTEELKAWFAKNTAMFTQPPRATFRHVYFSPDRRGPNARSDAQAALAKLAGKPAGWPAAHSLGDPFMFQDFLADRTPEQIAKDFGPPFARSLFAAAAGRLDRSDRVGLRLAPRLPRFADARARLRLRRSSTRREDRVARRAEGRSLGQGLQDDAGEIRAPSARAAGARQRKAMSPLAISAVIFVCVYGGAMAGMSLRSRLPQAHQSAETRDVVKLGMGLVATMSALLLGLLISSAKSSYDTQKTELTQVTARLVFLDHVLAHYGPETKEVRGLVRQAALHLVHQLWPDTPPADALDEPGIILDRIEALAPPDEAHRLLQTQALTLAIELGQTRGLMIEQRGSSVSTALLGVVVFWLAIIFVSFGLFAPDNVTVRAALLVCALSVSCAIFLILEMDRPFAGLLQIPNDQMRQTFSHLGQ